MTDPAAAKQLLAALLADLSTEASPRAALDRHCAPDCRWDIFYPFETQLGNAAAASNFWDTLRTAWPDFEIRPAFVVGGEYEGRTMVSAWGNVLGTFEKPWLGIPADHNMAAQRLGIHATVREGRITRVWVLLDLLDVMFHAGVYPFRRMPGSPLQWPFPPCDTGATANSVDSVKGAVSDAIVHEMQMGLPPAGRPLTRAELTARHSPRWHPNMNWYGPAGIGSGRQLKGFRNYHGALWLQAFADRTGFPRGADADEDSPGHVVRIGDGNYVATGGWPALSGTHSGPEWLGLPPTGAKLQMRVADWYRLDADGRIVDNWVMIDLPHMVRQMGMDIFHDLSFRVQPGQERWPEPLT